MSVLHARLTNSAYPQILLLAAAYVLFGRLALLLAVPPGYAMAVYPPAGIALGMVLVGGYRLAPGVALGSFLLNLWIGWETQGAAAAGNLFVPATLAAGAMLQAIAGAWLVRRFVGYPTALDKEWHILLFLLLSGPAASLVNATVGVGTLLYAGVVNRADFLTNWATWWIGDTLGVLTLTPLILIWKGEPANIWRSRRLNVGLPLAISLAIVVSAFLFVRQSQQERMRAEFQVEAGRIAQELQIQLNFHSEMVLIMERLFASSDQVTREDFRTFVSSVLARYPTLQALEWAPKVIHEERARFEAAARESGFREFSITDRDADGRTVPAAQRNEYYPIFYVEPLPENEPALGFDLASSAARKRALEQARDTGRTVASEPIRLIQLKNGRYPVGALLFTAVYARGLTIATLEQRRAAFRGVTVSVVRIGDLIEEIFPEDLRKAILFDIVDAQAPKEAAHLYDTLGKEVNEPISLTTRLEFGERRYTFTAAPSAAYWATHKSWVAWWSLVGGLFFTSLLGTYLLIMSGQAYHVDSLVKQRTRELSESEEKLKQNASLLQTIMDSASSCIYVRDLDGRFLFANKEYERVFGFAPQPLIGKSIEDVFPPDVAASYRDIEAEVIRNRTAIQTEMTISRDDGQHTFLIIRSPLFDTEGRVTGTCGVGTDLTQHKRNEERLHENMALLQAVMESTSSAVIVRNSGGRILYTNKEYDRLFSPDGESLIGKNIRDVFSPAEADDFLESSYPVIAQGQTIRSEVTTERKGVKFTHLLVRTPLRNEKGDIYGLCGVATDITLIKEVEKAMRKLNRQLAATTSLQNAILNSANFSIISTDTNGVIRVFNVGAQRMLGYAPEEMIGIRTPEILHDPAEVVARAAALSRELGRPVAPGFEVFVTRARHGVPDEHEWTYIRKDGSRLPVMLSVTALWDEQQDLAGFLGIAYDLTERKKMESMKNEFISTVSHELRTPLTSIRGALGLLVGGAAGEIEEPVKGLLDIANQESDRLVRLVDDFLDIEKIESGNMRFEMSVQHLRPLVEQAITTTQPFAAEYDVAIALDAVIRDDLVNADADRIIQVLVNLLSNAAKYSPANTVVRVRLAGRPGRVRLSVIDQGAGIPEEFHARIFQKFAQADSSDTRQKEGTGLGLSICKAIIEKHHGVIDFVSEPGQGTEFFFELPAADVGNPEDEGIGASLDGELPRDRNATAR